VVLKLWDAWNSGCEDRDKEVAIYEHLQSLWGISVPFLRVSTPIEYFHAIILQYVEGSPVSPANLTAAVESNILKAFDSIHALGVVHGDIRADNILVSAKGNRSWIIDFEFGQIVDVAEDILFQEMEEVKHLLRAIRNHDDPHRSL